MREQRMLVFYAELRGGKATKWVNLLSVNEYFSGKRNNKRAFLVSLISSAIEEIPPVCASERLAYVVVAHERVVILAFDLAQTPELAVEHAVL